MPKQETELITIAKSVEGDVIKWRRHLHQFPELRWEEDRTIAQLRTWIEALLEKNQNAAIKIRDEFTGGLVLDAIWNPQFDMVLLRADIDALPIIEATDLAFASSLYGVMHACGHDIHSAMLLGAFKALIEGKIPPKHNVRFVWQRAEENPITESGGKRLVSEGICVDVSSVHGLHISPSREGGTFFSCPGPMMANSDRLYIVFSSAGGHVAHPERGTNALDVATDVCLALRGFETLCMGPNEPIALVPAMFHSGSASNVRPSSAEIWFSVRNFLDADKKIKFFEQIKQRIYSVVSGYHGTNVDIQFLPGQPCLINSVDSYITTARFLQSIGMQRNVSRVLRQKSESIFM